MNGLSTIGQFYEQIKNFKNAIILIMQKLNDYKPPLIDPNTGNAIDFNDDIKLIKTYYEKIMMAKQANVRAVISLFYTEGILVYGKEIILRDEQFFLQQTDLITPELAQTYEIQQSDLLFMNQIKHVWVHLNQKIKNNIWDYVQIICLLAETAMNGTHLANLREELKSQGLLQ
jgi:hypothetical protein